MCFMIELSREICDTFIAVFVVLAHLRLENRKCSSSQKKGARYISTQSDKMVAEDHDLTYASTKHSAVGAGSGGHCVLKLGFTWTFPGNQDATLK